MLVLLALLQAAVTPPPPADPLATLHGIVVDNIRNCPQAVPGESVVCSRDRGFAEHYRLPKADPRFEKPIDPPDLSVEGKADPCGPAGDFGANGCTLKDYQAWLMWQRARDEKAQAAKRPER